MGKKSAPAKKKKAAAPDPANQIKRLQSRVKSLEDRIDQIVANLSNRLNFNPEDESPDIIWTGDSGASTSEPAPAEEPAAE